MMGQAIKLLPSGFPFIDKNWGGIYIGGSYLVVGAKKSGRTLLALQYAMEAVKNDEVCLLFTNMRPKDLMIQAASINFDVQHYMNDNRIIVVRISPPNYLSDAYNADDYLIEYFNDIVTVVKQYKPDRMVFDELTPYIGFRNLELLRDSFLHTLEVIEDKDITSLFIVGEPATPKAEQIVDVLKNYVTGTIYLKKSEHKIDNNNYGGRVEIVPNVGHAEGLFSSDYKIIPREGLHVEGYEKEEKDKVTPEPGKKDDSAEKLPEFKDMPAREEKKKSSFIFTNFYGYDDFLLILNNQIALFKSTGQMFSLLSFKFDPSAQVNGLLSFNQLKNAVRAATDKKDKITVVDNKIVVLVVKSTEKSVIELLKNIKKHLPSQDENYLNEVTRFISIYNVPIHEDIINSETMMESLLQADNVNDQQYVPLNKTS